MSIRLKSCGLREVLLAENHPAACISIAVVDNATIHRLNRDHLCHDWPTDVITFPLAGPGETACSGEVVVSAEMAVSIARELNGEPLSELGLYLIHGLLHLCGYDDKSEAGAAAMAARQADCSNRLPPGGMRFEPRSGDVGREFECATRWSEHACRSFTAGSLSQSLAARKQSINVLGFDLGVGVFASLRNCREGHLAAREDRDGVAAGLAVVVAVDQPALGVLEARGGQSVDQELHWLGQRKRLLGDQGHRVIRGGVRRRLELDHRRVLGRE